jgi:hypothetical protein
VALFWGIIIIINFTTFDSHHTNFPPIIPDIYRWNTLTRISDIPDRNLCDLMDQTKQVLKCKYY